MTGWSTLKKLIWLRIIKGGGSALRTVTGSLIHITDALAMPAKALTVNVEPIQDLHGYDSPWPAGGGANKFGGEIVVGKRWQDGSYVTAATDNYAASEAIINCSPSTEYCVTLPDITETTAFYCVEFDANGNYIRMQSALSLTPNNNAKVFSTSADAYKIAVSFYRGSSIQPASIAKFAINYPSTITTWTPYSNICPISGRTSATIYHSGEDTSDPTTYTIQLGETVYGGTVDAINGVLTVDRAMVDLGTFAWGYTSDTAQFYSNGISSTSINWHNWSDVPPLLCSQYKPISNAQFASSDFYVGYAYNSKQLRVKDSTYTDAATFKTAMSGVQLVYELATPIEITLTPTQIDMLLGENNLWADAGDLTLTYYADGNASTSEALGILLGGTYNNHGGADDVSDDEALGILLGGS